MNYDIENYYRDIIERTEKNLKFIDENKGKKEVYEVTQLVNSLRSFLVIPDSMYISENCEEKAKEQRENNIKEIYKVVREEKEYKQIKAIVFKCIEDNRYYCSYEDEMKIGEEYNSFYLIHHMRDAISHDNILYTVEDDEEEGGENTISHIYFYDILKKSNGNMEFCIKLNIDELKELIECSTKLFEVYAENGDINKKWKNDYKNRKKYYDELFR